MARARRARNANARDFVKRRTRAREEGGNSTFRLSCAFSADSASPHESHRFANLPDIRHRKSAIRGQRARIPESKLRYRLCTGARAATKTKMRFASRMGFYPPLLNLISARKNRPSRNFVLPRVSRADIVRRDPPFGCDKSANFTSALTLRLLSVEGITMREIMKRSFLNVPRFASLRFLRFARGY